MKILITVPTYYPRKDGVQKVTQYLAEGLANKGNEVTVITTNKGVNNPEEMYNGVKIKRINLYTKFGFYIGNKKEYKMLIDDKANNCDVMINVCTQNVFTDVILKNIGKYKCKKILYMHGMFDFKFHKVNFSSITSVVNKLWKEVRWSLYYNLNGKYFKKYNVVTQLHERDYGNIFFKKKYNIDSIIIENAADDEFFEKKTLPEFEKPFDKYLIYVANYDDNKNQKLAIKEFLKSDIDKNIGLVLIGSNKNSYYNMLDREIITLRNKFGLTPTEKPIKMLYDVDRNLVSSYVSNAYLYLMTSKSEKYPMSIVESMACGIPYICTNVGIVKYFVGGVVSNQNDINYWIEKLTKYEILRNEMSKLCITYAQENFKVKNKIKLLEKCIDVISK